MRTAEERTRQLHRRAMEMEQSRNRRQLAGFGGLSGVFAVLLISMLVQTNRLSESVIYDHFAGSSLLSESTGGYVLIAVIAFFVGVVLTAVIHRRRKK